MIMRVLKANPSQSKEQQETEKNPRKFCIISFLFFSSNELILELYVWNANYCCLVGAYGGLIYELQCLAKRIVSLCCVASGCKRNWSEFSHVSTTAK